MEGQNAKVALIPAVRQSQGIGSVSRKNNYVTYFNLESHWKLTNMVQI